MPGYELIGKEEMDAVVEVFKNGGVLYRYGLNQKRNNIFKVDEFERKIATKVGVRYALCVCNGTAALKLALVGLGIKPQDEVITQSFTFIATLEAILELGAVPVISEIDKNFNMDPVDLESKITSRTKAIIPVHMAGVMARMNEIQKVADKYKIPLIEDSAQALGASYFGKKAGTLGEAGIYSLDIGKIITTGEGGVLVTDREDIYLRAREYSDHGHEQNPGLPRGEDSRNIWGFNYKSTELHGAIGLAQLEKLDFILQRQRENKSAIKIGISKSPGIEFRQIPDPCGDAADTLIFMVQNRQAAVLFSKKLAESGIGTKNLPDAINWHFAGTWKHIFDAYPEYKGKDLEVVWGKSSGYLRRAIAIPIMVNMGKERIEHIIKSVNQIAESLRGSI